MNYQTQLTAKTLAERNEQFWNLSDEDKRREIALDAINILTITKLDPAVQYENYWSSKLMNIKNDSTSSEDFQERFLSCEFENCDACQRGLIMIARIRCGNKIDPEEDVNVVDGDEENSCFHSLELTQMESEFESSYYSHPYCSNTKKKMLNICHNILNNGFFNHEDETDYLV